MRSAFIICLYAFFAWTNVRGVRTGARTIEVMTAAKLVPLAIFLIAGCVAIWFRGSGWPGLPHLASLGRSSLLLIFAFAGIEVALNPSGEVREPKRTVPRAIVISLAFCCLLYIAIQVVAQSVLGPSLARYTTGPLVQASFVILGNAGFSLMLVGSMLSMSGAMSGEMLSSPRSLYAFSRRHGVLPEAVGRVHSRHSTPHIAIMVHATIASVLALTGTFEHLLIISNVSVLLLYLLACVACLELLRRRPACESGFRARGQQAIPIAACAVVLWLLSQATLGEFVRVGAVLLGASVLVTVRTWTRPRPRSGSVVSVFAPPVRRPGTTPS